jgi:hypothetical protein
MHTLYPSVCLLVHPTLGFGLTNAMNKMCENAVSLTQYITKCVKMQFHLPSALQLGAFNFILSSLELREQGIKSISLCYPDFE